MEEEIRQHILRYSYKENHEKLFTLASGNQSPYYINLKQLLLDPKMLYKVTHLIVQKIQQNSCEIPKSVAGLTMGADPLIYTLSLNSTIWFSQAVYPIVVRKKSKDHGSKQQIEFLQNTIKKTDLIILLDDVITTGNSTLQAFYALRENGFHNISSVYCIVDREDKGKENLEKEGLSLFSLYQLSDLKK